MLFNSLQFAIFFPITTLGFFVLPHRFRWLWLLAASVCFYMFFVPLYVLILAGTILVDYVAGLLIEKAEGRRRRMFLVVSIVANVGVLFFFKYFNFFTSSVDVVLTRMGLPHWMPALRILLPIGLSFHTFQSMSYTIEVYRGAQKAERNLGIFALYVMFYPQLVAGPIERPQNLLEQFHTEQRFEYQRVADGVKLMAWGFVKKMIVADRIALMVGPIYDHPEKASPLALLVATVFFAYQIYCDFSGYSDIALGSAQVMGFKLMKNFDSPYASRSIGEFWRRWHISLSTWFRDYVYVPLGGNRVSVAKNCRNLMIVFVLSGLWHGANWTFVIWGALHGTFLVVSRLTQGARERRKAGAAEPKLRVAFQILTTFSLVCLTWVFFRAKDVTDAFTILKGIAHVPLTLRPSAVKGAVVELTAMTGIGAFAFVISLASIAGLEIVQYYQRKHGSLRELLGAKPAWVRWGAYAFALAVLLVFSQTSRASTFIYFQF